MENEYYYLHKLEELLETFLNKESTDGEFGWLPDNLARRMAEAAYAVLKNSKEVTDYMERENLLNKA